MLDVSSLWPLKQLADHLPLSPRGKKVHRSTGFRWASRGVRGRKLKVALVGGVIYTCDAWLSEFLEAKPEPAAPGGRPADASARQDQILAAEHELRSLGL